MQVGKLKLEWKCERVTDHLWTCPGRDTFAVCSIGIGCDWFCPRRSSSVGGTGNWPPTTGSAGRILCSPRTWWPHNEHRNSCHRTPCTGWSQFALQSHPQQTNKKRAQKKINELHPIKAKYTHQFPSIPTLLSFFLSNQQPRNVGSWFVDGLMEWIVDVGESK